MAKCKHSRFTRLKFTLESQAEREVVGCAGFPTLMGERRNNLSVLNKLMPGLPVH